MWLLNEMSVRSDPPCAAPQSPLPAAGLGRQALYGLRLGLGNQVLCLWGRGSVSFRTFPIQEIVFTCLFTQSMIYLYQYGLTGIYFILLIIIQHYIFYLVL